MSNIKVAIRCRPLFEKERPAAGLDFQGRRILLDNKTYDPDYIFPQTATQDDVFAICQPILQSVKDGLHGTVMVYGQTGTGKTHTMLGGPSGTDGLAHRMIASMLEHVQQKTLEGAQCALTLSMIEIYNEKLTDMLSEGGSEEVTLIGGFPKTTTKLTLSCLNEAVDAIQRGLHLRHTAVTLMNERSSRSHVVIMVDYEEQNAFTENVDVAHLFLVDLAGSESIKKSQASGAAAGEAGKINKSLLALKSVFLALSNTNESTRPGHVPYRDSKLTEILQDSIGGTARTLLVACISAVGRDIEETKSTLMYAVKARSIRNAANTEREKLMIRLRSFEVENQRLRNRLQERVVERGGYYVTREEHDRLQQTEEESAALRRDLDDLLRERRQSSARQHISLSQTGVLHALLAAREEELQRFKALYQEALRRFDAQVGVLQRAVHRAVDAAREAVGDEAAAVVARLADWHAAALAEDADGALPFTRAAERSFGAIVARVNAAVARVFGDLLDAARGHALAVRSAAERRRAARVAAAEAVGASVSRVLAAHAMEMDALDADAMADADAMERTAALRTAAPPLAHTLEMQHAAREACRAVVQSARDVFPAPEVDDRTLDALRGVEEAFRQSATSASLGALLVLGSAAPTQPSGASPSSATAADGIGPLAGKDSNANASTCSAGGRHKRVRSSGRASDTRRMSTIRLEK